MIALTFSILFPVIVFGDMDVIRIGGLFDSGSDKQQMAFRYAVDSINSDINLLTHARLSAQSEEVPPNDSFKASRKACSILKNGVAAIFGPQSPDTAAHVQSICDTMEVPHIENRWDYRLTKDAYSVNVYPHPASLSKAYRDIVGALGWKKFCIIYEDNNGLLRVQELLKTKAFTVTLRQLPRSHDYRPMLKDTKKAGVKHIVLDVSLHKIQTVLQQAQQIGMMTSYHNYFITNLDLHTVDLENFRHGETNITGLRIIDPKSETVKRVLSDWGVDPRHFGNVIDLYPRARSTPSPIQFSDISSINVMDNASFTSAFAALAQASSSGEKKFAASSLTTEVALMYDAVHLFAQALHDLHRSTNIDTSSLDCDGDLTWVHGYSIINYMKLVEIKGLTGLIRFDKEGFRRDISLDIIELWKKGLTKVGKWDSNKGANYTRSYSDIQNDIVQSLQNKTLVVSTLLAKPYTMLREVAEQMTGNDRYEGFCVDLIHEISIILGFNYTIAIVADGNHGKFDESKDRWDGMIYELLSQKADLAIGDLTITYQRERVVDFTMPWMNLGVTILFMKPTKQPPNLFSFLSPLSLDVWLYMATAYLAVSVLLFVLARFSPYEWTTVPIPSDGLSSEYEKGTTSENNFTLFNCLWFCIGSLMQQGSDLLPRAISTRIVAGIWWFFTLIMISSYTANLAAFLTVERMDSPIESAEDLAKQTSIKYGCMAGGSTRTFFKTSNMQDFQRMYNFMEAQRPSVYTTSNKEGVDRVIKSKGQYAFLMESSSIEYITERMCELTQVGGLLDSKSYGIALPPGSPYTNAITGAILSLQENGRLQTLKTRWWKRGGQCKDDESKSSSKANELGLNNVGGVFVVLLAGMGLASVVAVCEFVWKSRKLATEAHASLWNEMGKELKCALSCGSPKEKPKRNRPPLNHTRDHDTNGPAYLPMEAYGSTYAPSQYSFQSKNPNCRHNSELNLQSIQKNCNRTAPLNLPTADASMGINPIGFTMGRDLIHGVTHAQSLDQLSSNLRTSRNSFKSELKAENLQSPDLPFQLISSV